MPLRPRVSVAFARALVLRCPRCGGRGGLRSWLQLRPACPVCGLAFNRGEHEDYWYGGFMFNIIAAELLTIGIVAAWLVLSYPDVPWTVLEFVAPALAIATPFLAFPFTRFLWLAWDLAFRPTEPGD
jgi:uncharacterized protein (DUF983 family)